MASRPLAVAEVVQLELILRGLQGKGERMSMAWEWYETRERQARVRRMNSTARAFLMRKLRWLSFERLMTLLFALSLGSFVLGVLAAAWIGR